MQTLVERIYEQKIGDGLYRMFSPDEIRIPARFPGIGIEERIDFPGPRMPTEGIPLEVMLGYQAPQSLYVMYSFGEPIKIGSWFEPLAGATLGPYEQPERTYDKFVLTGKGAIIPYGGLVPGGDVHETFLADQNGIFGGHTSIYGGDKKISSTSWGGWY